MAFVIKRGDTLPNLPFQIFQPDGITPQSLAAATAINIVVAKKTDNSLAFKKPCTITDAPNGIGIYNWDPVDTATAGDFKYEFEITWNTGDIQTVPVDASFDLTIGADLG